MDSTSKLKTVVFSDVRKSSFRLQKLSECKKTLREGLGERVGEGENKIGNFPRISYFRGMKNMKSGILLYLYMVCAGLLSAFCGATAGEQYNYRQITPRDGMLSNVRCVHAEKRGFVWIGSSTEGLMRFDNYLPRRYSSHDKGEHALPGNNIAQIAEDSLGQIWVLTNKGLARYRPETDDFYVPKQPSEPGGGNLIVHCASPVAGGMLFGSQNQIFRYDYADDKIRLLLNLRREEPYPIHALYPLEDGNFLCFNRWRGVLVADSRSGETRQPAFGSQKENTSILVDSQGRVWLSPYNRGIECFDPEGRRIAVYNTGNSALSNNVVLCMTEQEGKIWIGTDGGGINILDPQTKRISVLKHLPGNPYTLPCNSIRSLHGDANGTIWAGRIRGGLIIIRKSDVKIHVGTQPMSPDGLSAESVLCLYQEPGSEQVWIGTDGGGINRFDPRTERFTHYPSTFGYKIASIAGLSQQELLLSIFSKGLYTFDKRSGRLSALNCEDSLLRYQTTYSGQSVNLLRESDSTILFFAKPSYRYHTRTRRMERLETPDWLHAGFPIAHENGKSYFHDQWHVYETELGSNRIETLFGTGQDTLINSIARTAEGAFWIATDKGVLLRQPGAARCEEIPTPFFRTLQAVVCDTRGRVWAGTDNGIFVRLPDVGRFIPFGESEEDAWNEFQPKARLATGDGSVYLGGTGGLFHVSAVHTPPPADAPDIGLMDAVLDGERAANRPPDEELRIPWTNKTLVIRIRVQEDDFFRKRLYRFRVTGDSYQEEFDSNNPELMLRNLVPGHYVIEATCNTPGGEWAAWKPVLRCVVNPPWYRSGWFTALWILAAAGLILGLFFRLLRRKELRMQRELDRHRQQIAEDKVRFLINISHELRTPLTLILAPLGRLIRNAPDAVTDRSLLKKIYKQAQRMKELINMVLTLRKMETGVTTLHPQSRDVNEWVREIVEDFRLEADDREIELRVEEDPQAGVRSFDTEKCMIVLSNLLINALKHSPDRSRITVRTEYEAARKRIRISVIDRGCGLEGVDVERLFTRFYQGDSERSGSGIGLSYAKILVEQHGGTIGAAENPEGGATFHFELPATLSEETIEHAPRNYLNELLESGAAENTAGAEPDLSQLSMLVVEDDKELVGFLKTEFAPRTKQLFTAHDGVEALEILEKAPVDIIVSDVMMPRMNGYELCRQVKERIDISHIPVILLTARNDEQSQLLGYNYGADGYMAKPFEIEMLSAMIANLLRNRNLIRERYRQQSVMPAPEETAFSSADERFLVRLRTLVEENLQQVQFNIPYLCREIGMSRTVLYNKLKLLTGLNVKEYVTKIRIERACRLIRETDISITEVAEQTGFSSSRYFSTAFKQYMGVTPSQYKSDPQAEQES